MAYKVLMVGTIISAVSFVCAEGFDPAQYGAAAGAVGSAEGGPAGGFGEPTPNIGGLGGEEVQGGAETGAPDLDGDGVPDAFDLDSPGGLGTVPPNEQGVGGGAPPPPPSMPNDQQQFTPEMAIPQQLQPADMAAKNGMAGSDPEKDGLSAAEQRVFELIEMYHKKQSKARG